MSSSESSTDYTSDSESVSLSSDELSIDDNGNEFLGDVLLNKYLLIRKLNCGAYSSVWISYNISDNNLYAIKIQNGEDYDEGIKEISILNKLKKYESPYILKLIHNFIIEKCNNHYAVMVFKLYDASIEDILKEIKYFDFDTAKLIMTRVCEGLKLLHNKIETIHTDLKPDNFLITCENVNINNLRKYLQSIDFPTKIKNMRQIYKKKSNREILRKINKEVIDNYKEPWLEKHFLKFDKNNFELVIADFGTCIKLKYAKDNKVIQTRYYRAPEIIFQLKISRACDIWSLGCIFFELITGSILFNPNKDKHFNTDQYHLMEIYDLLGKPPQLWIDKCKFFKLKSPELFNEIKPTTFNNLLKEDGIINPKVTNILTQLLKYTDRPKIKTVLEIFQQN